MHLSKKRLEDKEGVPPGALALSDGKHSQKRLKERIFTEGGFSEE